jgi:hypothetical protein
MNNSQIRALTNAIKLKKSMIKKSSFPVTIVVEKKNEYGQWQVDLEYKVNNHEMLMYKYSQIKSLYVLTGEWRIWFKLNSIMNTKEI